MTMRTDALALDDLRTLRELSWNAELSVMRILHERGGESLTGHPNPSWAANLDTLEGAGCVKFSDDRTSVWSIVSPEALDLALHFFHLGADTERAQHARECTDQLDAEAPAVAS